MKKSNNARINKTAIGCHAGIDAAIFGAYFIEVLKGSRTVPYFLMIAVLTIIPVLIEILMYRKDSESTVVRWIMAPGYGILYAVAVFTTHSVLPFTYILPMLVVITLYSDLKFCSVMCALGVSINIADVAYKAVTVGFEKTQLPDIEIRVILITIICIYTYLTTRMLKTINEATRVEIEGEKEKAEKLLAVTKNLSGELTGDIELVDSYMIKLEESVNKMGIAMEEVCQGATSTTDSVQSQLKRTEEIQALIEKVRGYAEVITSSMDTASVEVDKGQNNMDELSKQTSKSKEANGVVVQKVKELGEQTDKMNGIIALITSVANRTGMLALNASIEAARAGEAGRGFAVVANQISDLSDQTKSATVSITDLIYSITEELREIAKAVDTLEENNVRQEAQTAEVAESLQYITDNTKQTNEKAQQMDKVLRKLVTANNDIINSIENISAITEEVAAHSSETLETCQENGKIVTEVTRITEKLNESARELKN